MKASDTFLIGGDISVSRLGYGAMRLCGPGIWGHPEDPAQATRVLRAAVDAGVQLIDTSDAYGPHVNESQIRAALHPYKGLCIATKGGLTRDGPGHWGRDGRPERLRACIEGSLLRLGVEVIDLYQLHAPDPQVPFEESFGVLVDARDAGLVRHLGLSNVSVDQIKRAQAMAPVATVQNRYNLLDREHGPVLQFCETHGIGFMPWYPLGAGPLCAPDGPLADMASPLNTSPASIALAWLLARSPVMLPIPGTSSLPHLADNVSARDITLPPEHLATLSSLNPS